MFSAPTLAPRNQLLHALPANEFRQLQPDLKRVEMPLGKIVYEVGKPIDYVYFPETSIFSTVNFFEDGASIETGITGNEGLVGINVALASNKAERETSVQAEGYAWQISADKFREQFEQGGALQHLVLRYVHAFLEQISQSGACINHHTVNQRLARWLLMCHDRTEGDKMKITHDFISQMLGVNRPSVTGAAIELKDEGLIQYSRGVVRITDRPGLEKFSCECYSSIRRVYENYLSLVDIRQMNERLKNLQGKMSYEMQRRRDIQKTTVENIQRLKKSLDDIKNPPQVVRICRRCQRVCDFRNRPATRLDFLDKRMDAEFHGVICASCNNQ
jgi:CRP-like cAMP-binding protein